MERGKGWRGVRVCLCWAIITHLCSEPGWVKELAEECHQLRESNELLHMEVSLIPLRVW